MKSILILTFSIFILSGCATRQNEEHSYKISSEIYNHMNLTFIGHDKSLRMQIRSRPVQDLYKAWQDDQEEWFPPPDNFFVTVIYPDEYRALLTRLTPKQIDNVALENYIQNSRINVVCLGQYRNGHFILLDSPDLKRIRLEVAKLFINKGGERSQFHPAQYMPYVELSNMDSSTSFKGMSEDKLCTNMLEITY